ncbi:Ras-related protein Ral-A-like isoform X2 [Oopsacas minuta]|uniref:Ras-related protein Ral-A-like isoform X2 n=1 Tax=Oopsacas minuta TaxID=111878 RepID=A0AAV7JKF1_9METZ|nr:Ras-related protein Ral-A-like isoform X2 [Oopsacas minuta]
MVCLQFMDNYEPTKADNYRKTVKAEDGTECQLDILDTAGQEDYPVVREAYYKDGEGFMLMFAINDMDSFTALDDFHEQITSVKGLSKPLPFLLVGNKVDLDDSRAVSSIDAQACASKWNCPFIETSAKTRINVDEAFISLFNQIHSAKQPTEFEAPAPEPKRKCCTIL